VSISAPSSLQSSSSSSVLVLSSVELVTCNTLFESIHVMPSLYNVLPIYVLGMSRSRFRNLGVFRDIEISISIEAISRFWDWKYMILFLYLYRLTGFFFFVCFCRNLLHFQTYFLGFRKLFDSTSATDNKNILKISIHVRN
jgi:hypothetical protein